MASKASVDKGFKIWMILFLLIDFRFFYLLPLPEILGGASSNKFFLGVFSLIFFGYYFIKSLFKKFQLGLFGKEILFLFLMLVFIMFKDFLTTSYSLFTIFWNSIPFFILLSYFPFREYFSTNNYNYQFFVQMASIFSIITSVLLISQVLLYSGESSVFLQLGGMISDRYLYNPSLGLRLYGVADGFFRIFAIVLGNNIITKKTKLISLEGLALILILLSIIIVDQSRYYLLVTIISLIFMVLSENNFKVTPKRLFVFLLAFFASLPVLLKNISSILGSILGNSGSSYARTEAISYYLNIIWNDLLFGLGRIIPGDWTEKYWIIKGPKGIYNYDDIGIIGVLASLGIIVFALYLYIVIKLIYRTVKRKNVMNIGITTLMILSLTINSYLDNSRIITLLFSLLLFELNYFQKKDI